MRWQVLAFVSGQQAAARATDVMSQIHVSTSAEREPEGCTLAERAAFPRAASWEI